MATINTHIKKSTGDIIFDVINYSLMIILAITALYPFLYLFSVSISEGASFSTLSLIPKRLDLRAYKRVLSNEYIASGFVNSVLRTVVGTLLTLLMNICTAYPLSKRDFPHRTFWTGFVVFTMFFSGGLIPTYLLINSLNLRDSFWVFVIPGLINTYNMIIIRNYLMSLPESLEESAHLDGANDFIILFWILIPISLPIIMTVGLWTAVGHWNSWFDSLIYIETPKKHVLQLVLRRIVLEGTEDMMQLGTDLDDPSSVNPDNVKSAAIVVTTLPIIITYPFIQKYFVDGIMVGSLKG